MAAPGPGLIMVKGYWLYQDKTGIDRPIRDARVEIWDSDSSGDTLLDTTYTDNSGYYASDNISNNDDEGGGQDIYVKVFSTDDRSVRVTDFSTPSNLYYFATPVQNDVADGDVDLGSYSLNDVNNRMAWYIYDLIANDAFDYLAVNAGWQNLYNLQVRWSPTNTSQGTGYHSGGSIDLLAGDRWDSDVFLHEYGHFVMYKIYGDYIPPAPNCSGHIWGKDSSLGCAWVEGWANFLQAAIQNDSFYDDTEDQTLHINFEPPAPSADHAEDEGAVAASLWDIFDPASTTESWDAIGNGINGSSNNGIWSIAYNDTPDDFAEFYRYWINGTNGHNPEIKAILQHHQIDPDVDAPTLTITTPTSGATYSTSQSQLTIGGTAADNVKVTQVKWSNSRGGSGTCSGTDTWSSSNIALSGGQNVITVTATDAAGNSATDSLTVIYTPPDTNRPTVTITAPTSGVDPFDKPIPADHRRNGRRQCQGHPGKMVKQPWRQRHLQRNGHLEQQQYRPFRRTECHHRDGHRRGRKFGYGLTDGDLHAAGYQPSYGNDYHTDKRRYPFNKPIPADHRRDGLRQCQGHPVSWSNSLGGSGTCSGTDTWSSSDIALSGGQNVITVTATDAAGNSATDSLTVIYTPPDTNRPTVTITAPTSGATHSTSQSQLTIGGTAADNAMRHLSELVKQPRRQRHLQRNGHLEQQRYRPFRRTECHHRDGHRRGRKFGYGLTDGDLHTTGYQPSYGNDYRADKRRYLFDKPVPADHRRDGRRQCHGHLSELVKQPWRQRHLQRNGHLEQQRYRPFRRTECHHRDGHRRGRKFGYGLTDGDLHTTGYQPSYGNDYHTDKRRYPFNKPIPADHRRDGLRQCHGHLSELVKQPRRQRHLQRNGHLEQQRYRPFQRAECHHRDGHRCSGQFGIGHFNRHLRCTGYTT